MKITRREATEDDIPFLLELRHDTMEQYLVDAGVDVSNEFHLERLLYAFDGAEVLILDGNPIGLLKVRRSKHEWEIVQMQISVNLQGKGIGRFLLQQVISEATAVGVALILSVLKNNPAKQLYERLGFEVVGENKHISSLLRKWGESSYLVNTPQSAT